MSNNWFIGDQNINYNTVTKFVHFNPALPYMYVPIADFTHITDIVAS
jgi:hypothetical protein